MHQHNQPQQEQGGGAMAMVQLTNVELQQPTNQRGNTGTYAKAAIAISELAIAVGVIIVSVILMTQLSFYSLECGIVAIICSGFIITSGVLGLVSFKDPTNRCKNGLCLGFAIVACCMAFVLLGVFSAGFVYYKDCDYIQYTRGSKRVRINTRCYETEKWLCVAGIILGVIEFILSLTASILGCRVSCTGCS